jgi:hypothetical protein
MFPERIRVFLTNVVTRTEMSEFVWTYDDMNATVQLRETSFTLTLRYSFSDTERLGEFVLIYTDQADKEYRFYTNQEQGDYALAQRLYEVAQSSGMTLPF